MDGVDLRSSDADRVSRWLKKNGPGEWVKWLSSTEVGEIVPTSVLNQQATFAKTLHVCWARVLGKAN